MAGTGSGTGSIRERSPGHYELRAYNPATRRQVTRTYRAPRSEKGAGIHAARQELAKLVAEVSEGKHGGSKATLGYLVDEYLRHGEKRGWSPTTLAGYRSNLRRIKASSLADKPMFEVTAYDLDALYLELRTEGMTPATVHHHHRLLRAALHQAKRWGWVSENPAENATVPSSGRPEMHVPTVKQARALVLRASETMSPDLAGIILFAMLTGLRRGELCGLRWPDVDWAGARLTVRRSVWEVRSNWGVKDTKTHQVRKIALDPAAMKLLEARRAGAEADAELARVELSPDAYIWSTHVDGHAPRTPDSITRSFARLCRTMEAEAQAAGRRERWQFRFHDLRHLSATQLIGAGVDARTVASRLGHSDPSVTLKVYADAWQSGTEKLPKASAES